MDYGITKDSAGNLLIAMTYYKIKLHTENGETVTDLDAANAANSTGLTEMILGRLKAATITATISPGGSSIRSKGIRM